MTLTASVPWDTRSSGGVTSVQWEVVFNTDVVLEEVEYAARNPGTYTFYVDGVMVGADTTTAADEPAVVVLAPDIDVAAGGVGVQLRVIFDASRTINFNDASANISGDGASYITSWHNARWPYTSGIQPESVAGVVRFRLPAAPVGLVLDGTLPALVDTLTLNTYTQTLSDNESGAILIRGASIEPTTNAPDVEPVPATVSEAEMRDKAVAYTQPTMVSGRPT